MKGTIQAVNKTSGGGFSESGEPIKDVKILGDAVECVYVANVYNNRGTYLNGNFTQSEYIITTKDLTFKAKNIQLNDKNGNVVCTKQVQSLDILDSVKRVRITV